MINVALAGLRIGYGISTPAINQHLSSYLAIDNTNIAGAVAALASLKDTEFLQKSRQTIAQSRQIIP